MRGMCIMYQECPGEAGYMGLVFRSSRTIKSTNERTDPREGNHRKPIGSSAHNLHVTWVTCFLSLTFGPHLLLNEEAGWALPV